MLDQARYLRSAHRRPILAVFAAGLAVFAAGSIFLLTGLAAQTGEGSDEPFVEEQRVTAVDAVVAVVDGRGKPELEGPLPSYLAPDDFSVRFGSQNLEVVAVDAPGAGQNAPEGEEWTLVIYFDLRLSSPVEVGWAALELAQRIEQLTALGQVEVMVADPFPRRLLEPTRDPETLAGILSQLALFPEGGEHELLMLRDELLSTLSDPASEIDPAVLVPFALAEEKRVVRRQRDALLTALVDEVRPIGSRRAVFLAGSGFDLEPERFFRGHVPPRTTLGPEWEEALAGSLVEEIETLGRTLAAYNWSVFTLTPPPDAPPEPGIRIGDWFLGVPETTAETTRVDPLDPHEEVTRPMLNFFNLRRQTRRDIERAESYLELGGTMMARESFDKAENAYRMALYHFADDPKTADRQVVALVALGDCLESQGRLREARQARARARELDPESVAIENIPIAEFTAPRQPFEQLAQIATGALIDEGHELARALAGLARRIRITYQVPGVPEGRLHEVDIDCGRRRCRLMAPGWGRSGTPETVALARLRRWLDDDQAAGGLDLRARWQMPADAADPNRGRLEASFVPPANARPTQDDAGWRVTLGFGDPEIGIRVRHERPEMTVDGPGRWTWAKDLELAPGDSGIAVLLEHLESGLWGAARVETVEEE